MSEYKIQTALAKRLQDLPSSPPVAWENSNFKESAGTLYLAESFIPNIKEEFLGPDEVSEYRGIYQILVAAPKGKGRFEGQETAQLLSEHFKRGLSLDYDGIEVRIYKVQVNQGYGSGVWYKIPISVFWKSMS